LGLTPLDARQRFDLTLRFFDRRGRVGAKVRFQCGIVFLQGTLGSLDRHLFQPLHAPLKIELEIITERVLGNVHSLRDLAMR